MEGVNLSITITEGIYIKNPLKTELGTKIVQAAIDLFYEMGYGDLNFKKVAERAETTEASVYRYFENKYKLLVYLSAWYWDFMHFMVMLDIRNIVDPKMQLKQAIVTLVNSRNSIMTPEYIDQTKLHHIIVENSSRVFHNRRVDKLSREGFYANYEKMVNTLSEIIKRIDKTYKFPIALSSTILDQSLNTEYYLEHLPSLTDKVASDYSTTKQTVDMIIYLVDRLV